MCHLLLHRSCTAISAFTTRGTAGSPRSPVTEDAVYGAFALTALTHLITRRIAGLPIVCKSQNSSIASLPRTSTGSLTAMPVTPFCPCAFTRAVCQEAIRKLLESTGTRQSSILRLNAGALVELLANSTCDRAFAPALPLIPLAIHRAREGSACACFLSRTTGFC